MNPQSLSLNETLRYTETPEILEDPIAALRRMGLYTERLLDAYEDQAGHVRNTGDALDYALAELNKTHRLMLVALDLSERSNKGLPILRDLIETSLKEDLGRLHTIRDDLPEPSTVESADQLAAEY